MEYSDELLLTAENNLNKFRFLLNDCNAFLKGILKGTINSDVLLTAINNTITDIDVGFRDDFNTTHVLKALNKLCSVTNKMLHNTSSNSSTTQNDSVYILAVVEIILNTLYSCGINLKTSVNESGKEVNFGAIMDVLNEFRCGVRNLAIESNNQELLKVCDKVRADVGHLGIKINDYGRKSEWIK